MSDDGRNERLAAYEKSLEHLYEENARLRAVAKLAILTAVGIFIVLGATVWMGRCG